MADDKNIGGMLISFLAGSVVGAALALIFAPYSGAETRLKIRTASTDVKDKALEKVDTIWPRGHTYRLQTLPSKSRAKITAEPSMASSSHAVSVGLSNICNAA